MKIGMVLEGGAMRGMYTAGVLDVLMENGVWVDGVVGVSAGAVFGSNYKSLQLGRAIRYNKAYCADPRYCSIRSLIKTGDLYGEEFCYHELPNRLDPFDAQAFRDNPVEFYVVATDVRTGEPVYHLCTDGDENDIQWMRASVSMPIVSRVVRVDGRVLLDGGISDPIPVEWFRSMGYERQLVILTRDSSYEKKKMKGLPVIRALLKKYPNLIRDMEYRHLRYNAQLRQVRNLENQGKALVLRPSSPVKLGRTEKDPEKLETLYQLGRKDALARMDEIKTFVDQIRS